MNEETKETQESVSDDLLIYSFKDYKEINPFYVAVYSIFSLGFYLIGWLFYINSLLEQIDDEAPDKNRGWIVLTAIPITIWVIMYTVKSTIGTINETAFKIVKGIDIIFWALAILLTLKYIYDFCSSFGRVTKTNGLIWYLWIYPGYFGVILIAFKIYTFASLIIFPIITMPIMQDKLNKTAERYNVRYTRQGFNTMHRKS